MENRLGKHYQDGRKVFILGAGFTKAFIDNAPLMVDEFGITELANRFQTFPHASRVIEAERDLNNGLINIERLMTRLEGRMPYDFAHNANDELGLLAVELLQKFIERIKELQIDDNRYSELKAFARYCVENRINCITFNYDDTLDKALWEEIGADDQPISPYWNPDGGYGFFCKPSICAIESTMVQMDLKPTIFY